MDRSDYIREISACKRRIDDHYSRIDVLEEKIFEAEQFIKLVERMKTEFENTYSQRKRSTDVLHTLANAPKMVNSFISDIRIMLNDDSYRRANNSFAEITKKSRSEIEGFEREISDLRYQIRIEYEKIDQLEYAISCLDYEAQE